MDYVNFTQSKTVTDLHDAEFDNRQRKTFQRLYDPPGNFSKFNIWNNQKNSVTKLPELMPQNCEVFEPSPSFLSDGS